MNANQFDLALSSETGGSYEIGGHVARWTLRSGADSKIIDLNFLGNEFEVTRESAGPEGRARLYVNGYTQPDGKLLQGRSLQELIRKLYYFGEKIIRGLDRIETKLDQIHGAITKNGRRVSGHGKLCLVQVAVTWPQQRYVPGRAALGGFSRVPLSAIPASQEMAAGEYRLLQIILFCAQGTGLLTAGKIILAKLASVNPAHVKHFLRSLCNRALIRPTGRILKYGVREYEVLTHPWLESSTFNEGGQNPNEGGQNQVQTGANVAPHKMNDEISKKDHHRDELKTVGTSIPDAPSDASTSSFGVEGHQKHQSPPARDHIKWPEYATWCASQKGKRGKDARVHDGIPTEKGFRTWLRGQKDKYRNKRQQPDYIDGYVLDGKFLTREEANRMALENKRLLDEDRFRPARKGRDGKVVIISEPK